jgi:CheY-like chemotaxis protein
MVVDDDVSVLFTIQTVLEAHGVEVVPVLGGAECVQRIRDGFRGLIFMDIMMPDMDGWDTIEQLAQEGLLADNRICVLTALHGGRPNKPDLDEWVIEYIPKPFDPQTLVKTVEKHCPAA